MRSGFSRIYEFRRPDGGEYSQSGPDPYRKLKIIIAVIVGLYALDLWLTGTQIMINRFLESLIAIPVILISLSFHEFAHAWMADFLGDPTPRRLGRLSLDPRRHLDLFGTILLFFSNFGWAKPVPVDPENFRVKDRAMMSVALAGPLMNLFLAVMGGALLRLLVTAYPNESVRDLMSSIPGYACTYIIAINLGLAFFNLIPLPPLDGSKVLHYFLSARQRFNFKSIEAMGPLILILLVSFGLVGKIIGPLVEYGFRFIFTIFF